MQPAWNFVVRASADLHKAIADGFAAQAAELRVSADESGIGDKVREARLGRAQTATAVSKKIAKLSGGAGSTLEIDVFDDIVDGGWYYGISARYIRDVLKYSATAATIKLQIDSDGGSAFEGISIYNLLTGHGARVEAHIICRASSAASLLAMAADEVTMEAASWMMIHNASGGTQGAPEDLRSWADVLEKLSGQAAAIYAARTKLPLERITEMMTAETWMTAAEAKELGFADVVKPVKNSGAAGMRSSSRSFAMMRIDDFDNVPAELRAAVEAARARARAVLKAVPYKKYPVDEESSWDAGEAETRIRKWASSDDSGAEDKVDWGKYRRAFTWYDEANAETFGAYKLPHHDVVDGELKTVRAGVIAAGNAVNGARDALDIPDDELPEVRSHLQKHYHDLDLRAPWEAQERAAPAPALAASPQATVTAASPAAPAAIDPKTAGGGGKRTKAMDLKTLKAEHPEVFEAAMAEGVTAGAAQGAALERKRCMAHVKMAKTTGAVEVAHKAIENGASIMDEDVHADYMSAALNRTDRGARQSETAATADATNGATAANAANNGAPAQDLGDKVVATLEHQRTTIGG